MCAWRTLFAVILVAGLGVALVVVLVTDNPRNGTSTPTLAEASGSLRATTTSSGTTSNGTTSSATTSSATTSSAATSATTAIGAVPGPVVAPAPVIMAVRDALTAWGEYAISGRIRDLGDHFVAGGPQRRQLRAEAEAIRADPPGVPPYVVTTGEVLTISITPTDVVLRTEIEWSREGEATRFFVWDIQMQLVDGSWQLYTVVEVEEGAER